MIRTLSAWREACAAALSESEERKLLPQVECAINALERRCAEWGDDPGSPEELKAILRSITEIEGVISKTFEE